MFVFLQYAALSEASSLTNAAVGQVEISANTWWPYWLTLLLALLVVLAGRIFWHRLTALRASLGQVIFLVTVPREIGSTTDKPEKITQQSIQEQIAVAEVLWSAIGGLKAPWRIKSWFRGRSDHMSLELVAQDGLVSFYVAVPAKFRSLIEQQIQSHFPHAMLEEVADYNIFTPRGVTLGAIVRFGRSWAFPLKTYKQFETDPLNAITNSLAKVAPPEAAAIQIVIRSAHRSWRRRGIRIASAMQQGKNLIEAANANYFFKFLYWLSNFIKSVSTSRNSKGARHNEFYRLSPLEQEMVKGLEQKANKAGLDVTCRVVATAATADAARLNLNNILQSFSEFNVYQYGNRFRFRRPISLSHFLYNFIHRVFVEYRHMVWNTEELASIYHFPLPTTETPNIRWLSARKAAPPSNLPEQGLELGYSEYRGLHKVIKMTAEDRARHFYIIGKSGTGKSVLMEHMAAQDIAAGRGVCVIDPHGELVESVLARVPAARAQDVIIFNPADMERPQGLNLLEYDPAYPEQKTFVINEMIKILDKLYDLRTTGGPMFEQYMRNSMLLVMDDPASGATLMEISKVLADPDYRRYKLSKINNPVVYDFWVKEAQKAGGEASLANMVPYITSKLNQFVANDTMRPIIGQQHSAFNFREVMDQRKIILVNLSKGKIGELNAYLLGLVMVGKILMAALSRTDMAPASRVDFYLYIDEFQNFITDSISTILSEARKYRLNLIIAHQYIGQLVNKDKDTRIRDSVFGNVGTMVSFRVGPEDAEFLAKEYAPVFTAFDLINQELFNAYAKLLINNKPSRPFNFHTLPPVKGDAVLADKIKQLSRLTYGKPREQVESDIVERVKLGSVAES
ncbi:MAG: type IV secretion system DNA-binding domain-containing protein [Candidatus Kerfeldbacteria bacterium]|nr:type IV secretion system DNA-binding domain-containing protein [Candidatus Kerfeldbacteria bacterium]